MIKFQNTHTSKLDILYQKEALRYFDLLKQEVDDQLQEAMDVKFVKEQIEDEMSERIRGLYTHSKIKNAHDNHFKSLLIEGVYQTLKAKKKDPINFFLTTKVPTLRKECTYLYESNPGTHNWDPEFLNASEKQIVFLLSSHRALLEIKRYTIKCKAPNLSGVRKKLQPNTIARYKEIAEYYTQLLNEPGSRVNLVEIEVMREKRASKSTLERAKKMFIKNSN